MLTFSNGALRLPVSQNQNMSASTVNTCCLDLLADEVSLLAPSDRRHTCIMLALDVLKLFQRVHMQHFSLRFCPTDQHDCNTVT